MAHRHTSTQNWSFPARVLHFIDNAPGLLHSVTDKLSSFQSVHVVFVSRDVVFFLFHLLTANK